MNDNHSTSELPKFPARASGARDQVAWLTVAPLIWAAHFLASYLTAAIWCAKFASPDGSARQVQLAISGYTVLALLLIAGVGGLSYRRHRVGDSETPHDDDTLEDQRRFLGFAEFLLSLLSGVATIFTALVVVFLGDCH